MIDLDAWEAEINDAVNILLPGLGKLNGPDLQILRDTLGLHSRIIDLITELKAANAKIERFKYALEEIKQNAAHHDDNSISSRWLVHITSEALEDASGEKET